jgi:hypothetical protein
LYRNEIAPKFILVGGSHGNGYKCLYDSSTESVFTCIVGKRKAAPPNSNILALPETKFDLATSDAGEAGIAL